VESRGVTCIKTGGKLSLGPPLGGTMLAHRVNEMETIINISQNNQLLKN